MSPPAFLGNGLVNTTATGQTAAQSGGGIILKSYDISAFKRQKAARALTLKASASAGLPVFAHGSLRTLM